MTKVLQVVDMFCGGGGESTGITQAAKQYNFDIKLSAINHWKRAIETHTANYPFAEHYDIDDVHLADDSPYFEGCIFDMDGHIEGTVRWDKKTFNKFMESFHELF